MDVQEIKNKIEYELTNAGFGITDCNSFGKAKGAFGFKILLKENSINWLGILIPKNYPYTTCSFYVDKSNFLKFPHVEGDGKLCLGVRYNPGDETDPLFQIRRAFVIISEIAKTTENEELKNEEFKKEIFTWWRLFCYWQNKDLKKVSFFENYIVKPDLSEDAPIAFLNCICTKVPKNQKDDNYKELQIIVSTDSGIDPVEILNKNFFRKNLRPILINKSGLYVKIPSSMPWNVDDWPTTFCGLSKFLEKFDCFKSFKDVISKPALPLKDKDLEKMIVDFYNNLGIKVQPTKKEISTFKKMIEESNDFLVVLEHSDILYGYQIELFKERPFNAEVISPILNLNRIDNNWLVGRDTNKNIVENRKNKKILIVGLGAIGGYLAKILVKSGIGSLTLVDDDILRPENLYRHQLDIASCGRLKVNELKRTLEESFPFVKIKMAGQPIQKLDSDSFVFKENYDLIIDCSAEQVVRSFIWRHDSPFKGTPVAHIWLEPFCLAGHVAMVTPNEPWPNPDPIDSIINASNVPIDHAEIKSPSCGGAFTPYDISDSNQVTSLASKYIMKYLDENILQESYVVSLVKNITAYSEKNIYDQNFIIRKIVSRDENELQTIVKRTFKELKLNYNKE